MLKACAICASRWGLCGCVRSRWRRESACGCKHGCEHEGDEEGEEESFHSVLEFGGDG